MIHSSIDIANARFRFELAKARCEFFNVWSGNNDGLSPVESFILEALYAIACCNGRFTISAEDAKIINDMAGTQLTPRQYDELVAGFELDDAFAKFKRSVLGITATLQGDRSFDPRTAFILRAFESMGEALLGVANFIDERKINVFSRLMGSAHKGHQLARDAGGRLGRTTEEKLIESWRLNSSARSYFNAAKLQLSRIDLWSDEVNDLILAGLYEIARADGPLKGWELRSLNELSGLDDDAGGYSVFLKMVKGEELDLCYKFEAALLNTFVMARQYQSYDSRNDPLLVAFEKMGAAILEAGALEEGRMDEELEIETFGRFMISAHKSRQIALAMQRMSKRI